MFPTILHWGTNRIVPPAPIFIRSNYWRNWSRILMMQDGFYLTVQVTAINPGWDHEWEEMMPGMKSCERLIWYQRTPWKGEPAEKISTDLVDCKFDWKGEIRERLGDAQTDRLLQSDLWSELEDFWPESPRDAQRLLSAAGNNGGLPLADLVRYVQEAPVP